MVVKGVSIDGVSRTFVEYRAIMREPKLKLHRPSDVRFSAPLVKYRKKDGEEPAITLNIALLAACMQSVSGTRMGIACAQEGLLSATFQSQPIADQAKMVRDIKRAKAGFQMDVVSIRPEATVEEARALIENRGYSNIAVTEGGSPNGKLLGFISENAIRHLDHENGLTVKDITRPFVDQSLEGIVKSMVKKKAKPQEIIRTVKRHLPYGKKGITLSEANNLLLENGCKFIPIVDDKGNLYAVVFDKDLKAHQEHPHELIDAEKRLMAAAGINTHDYRERVPELADAGANVLFIDSSNGFTEYQKECIEWVKREFKDIPIIGGNVITKEGFEYLVNAGADAIKIGMGGGSICITQEQKGTGRGQASALFEIAMARDKYCGDEGIYVPLICDGGIVNPKDIAMAYAFGADVVMMGRWFARLDESPSDIVIRGGQRIKPYWGEGTERARNWQRYVEGGGGSMPFEEGVEGWVPHAGPLSANLQDAMSKMAAFFCDNARLSIMEMHDKPIHVERVSTASIKEGRPHDILVEPSGDVYSDRFGTYRSKEWSLDKAV